MGDNEAIVRAIPPLAEADLLLVIGHLHDDEFRGVCASQVGMLEENVWALGGKPTSYTLKIPTTNSVDESLCPVYNLNEWKPLFKLYPPILQKLRSYQWGALFCSRRPLTIREHHGVWTSAFYRQFNLHNIIRKGKMLDFEREVLKNAGDHHKFGDTLAKLDNLTMGKTLSEREQAFAVCAAYDANWPWDDPALMESLTDSLTKVIPKFVGVGSEVKEHDSFVAHKMLRSCAGFKENLDHSEHIQFLQKCLKRLQGDRRALQDVYTEYLHEGLRGRRIVVFHDLGTDPMNEDWLALAMMWSVCMIK